MESKNLVTNETGQQLLTESQTDSYLSILIYSFQDFLRWWYIKMVIWHLRELGRISTLVDDQTSLSLLVSNFFLPWHRDRSAIGYLFGIVMKILYIPIALAIYLLSITMYSAIILAWLALPIGTLAFILTSILNLR